MARFGLWSAILERRILAAIGASSTMALTFAACVGGPGTASSSSSSTSGAVPETPTSGTSGTSGTPAATCTSGTPKTQCTGEGVTLRGTGGNVAPRPPDAAALPPRPDPVLAANGCWAKDEVEDGCCNPAVSDPVKVGDKCCWTFCEAACCGRPIRVLGMPVVAAAVERSDWSVGATSGSASSLGGLDPTTRQAIHDSLVADALMEHASIASFAVLTLELLALGAPPDLVRGAQSAAADEIEHARVTFGLVAAFGDAPAGPSKLPLEGVAPSPDLATVAAACVRDGCIGETIASLVAQAQAEGATDPHVRAIFARIAEDEARHAELAWRIVHWALSRADQGDEGVREAIESAFSAEPPRVPDLTVAVDPAAWRASGRLHPSAQDALAFEAMRSVIAPCAAELLRSTAAATPAEEAARRGVASSA